MSLDPNQFTEKTNETLSRAQSLAVEKASSQGITPLHLLSVLLDDTSGLAPRIFRKAEVDVDSLRSTVDQHVSSLPRQDPVPEEAQPSSALLKVLRNASQLQKSSSGDTYLSLDHLLSALLNDSSVKKCMKEAKVDVGKVQEAIKEVKGNKQATSKNAEQTYDALERYGQDLTALAEEGKLDPVIGRDDEIRRTIQILSRRTKNNPVLVGEAGVGKTAIVEGLAQRVVLGDVPENLHCKIISLDMGALVAGASHRGEFEDRLKSVLKEVKESDGGIVLFIDEIHLVLGAGQAGGGAMDAANLLKPMLARGELRCIGATTLEEYRKHIEKDAAFERRFQHVNVGEPTVEDTVSILRGLRDSYETHHGVRIMDSALVLAAKLADRYVTARFLPDKAIDLVDEACANIRVQLDSQPEQIDQLERRKLQLEVEATALQQEKDQASKDRLRNVKKELAKVEDELQPLILKHQEEKKRVNELREWKQKLEALKQKLAQAERTGDMQRAADLRYGAIPDTENYIQKLSQEHQEQEAKVAATGESDKLLSEVVTPENVADVVSRWTGIPVKNLTTSERERLLRLGDRLKEQVVGQDAAVDAVASAVQRSRAGMSNERRPTGSFLFLGPTGVGKTELAKALARELFDDDRNIVRIDMSEYMESHSVSRLIGAPPGYVGYEAGGQLTEKVRRRPYNVILFDEVEKAHRQVVNVLLQILDDGRVTDGQGRTVDFTNTVIILTSNVGAHYLLETSMMQESQRKQRKTEAGMDLGGITASTTIPSETEENVMTLVRQQFAPEFLNRLDDIIMFGPLQKPHLKKIIMQQVDQVLFKLKEKKINLQLSSAALDAILEATYSPSFGARPLRRWLEKHIATEVSKQMIAGDIKDNSDVLVDVDPKGRTTKSTRGGLAGGEVPLTFHVTRKAATSDSESSPMSPMNGDVNMY